MASTTNRQVVAASPEAVWDAFMDPAKLLAWLPPGGMRGVIHEFDGRVGGGYVMSLFYPDEEQAFVGKTAEKEDRVRVRFTALEAPRRIAETIAFDTEVAELKGEMRMIATLSPVADGTEVTMVFEDLPPGLKPEDNEEGGRISLGQLAALLA